MSTKTNKHVVTVVAIMALLGIIMAACAPAATPAPPETVKETVVVVETVPVEVQTTVEVEKVVTPEPSPETYRAYTYTGPKYPDGTSVIYMAGMSVEQQRALREDANWFKQATNIDLQIELGDDAKFNALIAAGTPPDLYYCSTPGLQAADGTFAPIGDYIDQDFLDRYPQEFIDGYTGLDGKLYGLQLGGWFPVVMVNTKMLSDAGITVPDTDWTWEQVVDIGQQITKDVNGNGPQDAGFDPENVDVWGFWAGWFADDITAFSNGARRFDETGTRSLVDDPKFIEAWKWWADLTTTYKIMPTNTYMGSAGMSASEMFFNGQLAMFAEGINYDLYRRANDDLGEGNWKMVAYPHPSTHDLVLARYQGGACMTSKTANPEATVEALKFIAAAGYPNYPNLWLKDSDVVNYWTQFYPFLSSANYADTMNYSLSHIGPEPWNGKAAPFNIDRYTQGWNFWNDWNQVRDGSMPFEDFDFAGYAKEANEKVVAGMQKDLVQGQFTPEYKAALEQLLAEREADLGN